jgi:hypothetical protein
VTRSGDPRARPPPLFPDGRYAAQRAGASLSFVVRRLQITRLQVRMPLSCRDTRTRARVRTTLAFAASAPGQRANTYSRIYLPADGSANVAFVVDDDGRRPEIYLTLQLRGATGRVSLHARSETAGERCDGELGLDVRAR